MLLLGEFYLTSTVLHLWPRVGFIYNCVLRFRISWYRHTKTIHRHTNNYTNRYPSQWGTERTSE